MGNQKNSLKSKKISGALQSRRGGSVVFTWEARNHQMKPSCLLRQGTIVFLK